MKPRKPFFPQQGTPIPELPEESDEPPVTFVETLYVGPADATEEFDIEDLLSDEAEEEPGEKEDDKKKKKIIILHAHGIRTAVDKVTSFTFDKKTGKMSTSAKNPLLTKRIENPSKIKMPFVDPPPKKKKP